MAETTCGEAIEALAEILSSYEPGDIRSAITSLLAECERLGVGVLDAEDAYNAMLLELATDIRQRVAVGRWPGSGGRRWGH